MRIAILATGATAGGLILAGVLGIASAETTTTGQPSSVPPPRLVSVQGVASEPVAQNASAQSATGAYHQALGEAVSDALTKAQLLAGKAAVTLGPAQSVTEDGGEIQCAGEAEYEGEAGDIGSSDGTVVGFNTAGRAVAPALSGVAGKPGGGHVKHKKHRAAKKASAAGCAVTAEVSLTYSLS
jgi:hypothetical protein